MTDIALLPCPFCGNAATTAYSKAKGWKIECEGRWGTCTINARTHYQPTKPQAIDAWNRRSSPSQVAPANPAQVTDAMAIVDASLPPHEQAMLGQDAITVLTEAIAAAIGAGTKPDLLPVKITGRDGSIRNAHVDRTAGQIVEADAIGAGGQAVAVKPLEWEETKGNYEGQAVWSPKNDAWPCWVVKNPDTDHYVWCEELGIELVPASPVKGTYPTLETAKAAAQADYERRILSALSQPHPADERVVEAQWHPLTHKDDKMTCPMPADETVVEVMLQDGTVCPAWYSCNIMEAGDWDFLPVKDDGEPDDEADSIASRIVAWRALAAKEAR